MACWYVSLWKSKMHIMFCFTQVNSKDLTLIRCVRRNCTQVVAQSVAQSSSELWNCQAQRALSFFQFVCLLNSPNFSKMTFPITMLCAFFRNRIGSNFLFILYSDLYFMYSWNPFDSYYYPVKQNEEFVKVRQERHKGRSWWLVQAAMLRVSLIISKSKRLNNKDKT